MQISTSSNRRLLWSYLKSYAPGLLLTLPGALTLGIVSAVVAAASGPAIQAIAGNLHDVIPFAKLLGPILGELLRRGTNQEGVSAAALMTQLPLLLVAAALVKSIIGLSLWFFWEWTGESVSRRMRDDLAGLYLHLDPVKRRETLAREMEADLSSGVTTDVKLMREYIVHFYGGLPRDLIQVLFSLALLLLLSPKLTLLFLLGVAPAIGVGSRIGKKVRRRAARALADYSQLSEWLQQRLLGIETIKHYRTETLEAENMERLSQTLYVRFLSAAKTKARTSPAIELLAVTAMAIVLWIAFSEISEGQATGAVFISFFAGVALLSQSAGKLGRYLNSNREGAAAVDRLRMQFVFLAGHQKHHAIDIFPGGEHASRLDSKNSTRGEASRSFVTRGTVALICRNLTARYQDANTDALHDFSFRFDGGRTYCLAGPSGAGKSTLFNLLLGLMDVTTGEMVFESPKGLGHRIAYMPQRVLLAPDSLAANVAYPDQEFNAERVTDALARVGLGDLAANLPGRLSTAVGEGGHGVSGGQAQRILLARLWYHKRPFVLIDEGTSALDSEVERLVQQLIKDLARAGAAVITIAHRRAIAEGSDVLLMLDGGKLLDVGPPQEVLARER